MAHAPWYGLPSLHQQAVVNIVYIILAMSIQQRRQNAYHYNLFQVLDLERVVRKLRETTVFYHSSVSRDITM